MIAQDTDSIYDQKWLLTGTWIDWFKVDEAGQVVRLWDPVKDNCTVSPLARTLQDLGVPADSNNITEDMPSSQDDEDEDGSLSEGTEEEELCPTYDWPSLSDPYGRLLHPDITAVIPPNTSRNDFIGRRCGAPFGTLCFSTVVLNFTLSQKPSSELSRLRHILDVRGKECGFVRLSGPPTEQVTIQPAHTLLLLSVASFGILSMTRQDIKGLSLPYQSGRTPREDELPKGNDALEMLDYFNVMLVRPSGVTVRVEGQHPDGAIEASERAGLGLIHRDAIAQATSEWKHIFLV